MKINYKYQTKESSLENGKVNKNKSIFNSAEKSRKGLRSKTHNNYNRKITRVDNKLNKENKEICCTENCANFRYYICIFFLVL